MAKISLQLARGKKYSADSLHSLCLAFSAEGSTRYAPTGIRLKQNQWDARKQMVTRHPDAKKLTVDATRMLLSAQEAMLEISGGHQITGIDAAQLRDLVMNSLNEKAVSTRFFLNYMIKFAETRPKPNTRSAYSSTISRLKQYNNKMSSVLFDSINPMWLRQFDKWLSENGCPSVNARSVHFRNIRAVFNAAIDDGITVNYPFRKWKIRHEATPSRALSVKAMRELILLNLDEPYRSARDCFLLSFYLIGINMTDLWGLEDVTHYIIYNREKTGKLYEFRLQPEAKALWPVMDWVRKYKNPHSLVCMVNRFLKTVGKKIGYPGLTTYSARYTWATVAALLDIPKETIAMALGHTRFTVTDTYITFDHSKIDKANRAVIDYILNGL